MRDFQRWARDVAGRMESTLAELMPTQQVTPGRLHDAMRYSTLGGGKRVRAMLVFAAFLLGLVLGLQRRATGGVLAPIITHITWSTIMLFALPALIS